MVVVYNFIVLLLRALYAMAALFDSKAEAFDAGRKDFFRKFKLGPGTNNDPLVWVHCASLGEFEQGRTIIERIKKDFPQIKILLTFFSPSGYEVRKNYNKADYILYLPWDTATNARQFVEISQPVLAVFVKYEFWHHYAAQLRQQNIPLISVSAIFRPGQIFFQRYGGFYRNILHNFSYFFVQNEESVRLLRSIGIDQVVRAGDTRFDRVHQVVKQAEEIPIARQFKGNEKVMVIGSCWPEDLDVLIPFINENSPALKFIVAPHEVTEAFIHNFENAIHAKSVRYSKALGNLDDYSVLIIDNVGMLARLYRYGEFAYVGGAFGKGLHNILEAACYGIPVFFGNKSFEKFQEAIDLITRGGAFEVADYRDMKFKYEAVNNPQNFLVACEVTRQYVEENLGATDKILEFCKPILTGK
jgi:3-deoxy-D-manno-octulosonic-acid transferase